MPVDNSGSFSNQANGNGVVVIIGAQMKLVPARGQFVIFDGGITEIKAREANGGIATLSGEIKVALRVETEEIKAGAKTSHNKNNNRREGKDPLFWHGDIISLNLRFLWAILML